jgi:hypothetical protein
VHEDSNASIRAASTPGTIIVFGSGEMTSVGRGIVETQLLKASYRSPLTIGILETPTGFEVNAKHAWPERMSSFYRTGLQNFSPRITRIAAWSKNGDHSTNDESIVSALDHKDLIYCGAGSPTYVISQLEDSKAYEHLVGAHQAGSMLVVGSATAMAMGTYAIPVYEIFKVGSGLYWQKGLNFFAQYGMKVAIVPHWNNTEGEDFDTSRCFMGVSRFAESKAEATRKTPS